MHATAPSTGVMGEEHKSKKQRTQPRITEEERQQAAALESFLFARDEAALDRLGAEAAAPVGADDYANVAGLVRDAVLGAVEADEAQGLLIYEDRGGGGSGGRASTAAPAAAAPRRPAWEDPDDVLLEVNVAVRSRLRKLRQVEEEVVLTGTDYEQRLRQQHSKLNPRTGWASLSKTRKKKKGAAAAGEGWSEDEAEGQGAAAGLLQQAGGLLARGAALPPGMLETTRLKDANQAEPCESVVRSVEFHSNGQLLLVAGLDKRLRFFNVDGVANPKVQSVYLQDMPVHKAAFAGGGTQVVAAGRRRFFYHLDLAGGSVERVAGVFGRDDKSLESFVASHDQERPVVAFFGNDGHIPLVSLKSRQSIGSLKMNGTVRSGAFTADGTELLTSGGDGQVYVWDLRTQRCRQRYVDEGCLNGTSLACSPDGGLFATGSSSGVVNIYQRQPGGGAAPAAGAPQPALAARPLKSVMNLTTAVDSLAFNSDAQILAVASRLKRDALRLVHLPTCTVFSNWPTSRSPLHYVHSLAFSPGGGLLAIGNAKGRVLLYRLHHYAHA